MSEERKARYERARAGEATEEDRREMAADREKSLHNLLENPLEEFFTVTPVELPLPEKARIEPSETCALCGEPVMASKLEMRDGRRLCRGCLAEA